MNIYRAIKWKGKKYLPWFLALIMTTGIYSFYQLSGLQKEAQGKSEPRQAHVHETHILHQEKHKPESRQVQKRMKQRSDRIIHYCESADTRPEHSAMEACEASNPSHEKTYFLEKHRLVANIVSVSTDSVLKKILLMLLLEGSVPHKNPFRINDVDISAFLLRSQRLSIEEILKGGKNTVLTFVKDPYARLLSFYMDNLYIPNSWSWRTLARNIVPNDRRTCIQNVTFPEFVKYFVKIKEKDACSGQILRSNVQESDPCNFHYGFVGKYETLEEDLDFILKEANLSKFISLPNFKTDNDITLITNYVSGLFAEMPDISMDCGVDFKTAVNRVWRRLQGKGILGRYVSFPFEDDKPDKIPQSRVQTLTIKSYLSEENFDRESNPELALKEAYALLSDALISQLQKIFALDFNLYGYDAYPDYIREGRSRKNPYFVRFLDLQ